MSNGSEGSGDGRTVIRAGTFGGTPLPGDPTSASRPPGDASTAAPDGSAKQVTIGARLNHMYEVRRFVARGGMGEVFEGVSIEGEERVAIKVILPELAADAQVQAMFRREQRTLLRLSHPALVGYRTMAQEPLLGVLYIVTEFIAGPSLADLIGQHPPPSAAEVLTLLRRLADGLRSAHALGAVHRDMSPDNVLLQDGKLDQARIIDFGIAKDTTAGAQTLIGTAFAGKLGYAAPEQFGGEVGPWSDVYSLGLVILAVAQGKRPDLGTTLMDAIDRRRRGLDLNGLPTDLRTVLEPMLRYDAERRLRSMDEVIRLVDRVSTKSRFSRLMDGAIKLPRASPAPAAVPIPIAAPAPVPARGGWRDIMSVPVLVGASVALLALIALAVEFLPWGGGKSPSGTPSASPVATARAAIGQMHCAWLDVGASEAPGGVRLALTGVAGDPSRAQAQVRGALAGAGATVTDVDNARVAPIVADACTALDAFRTVRNTAASHLTMPGRPSWEIEQQSDHLDDGGRRTSIYAAPTIAINFADPRQSFALFGISPTGIITAFPTREELDAAMARARRDGKSVPFKRLTGGGYSITIGTTDQGWAGIFMISGRVQVPATLVTVPPSQRNAAWQRRFADAARAGGWKTEMIWFKVVNAVAD